MVDKVNDNQNEVMRGAAELDSSGLKYNLRTKQYLKDPNGNDSESLINGYKSEFSSDTALNNGQTFDSGIVDIGDYQFISTEISSDQDGSLVGTWYDDANGTNVIRTFTSPYSASDSSIFIAAPRLGGNFLRYVFTNNSGSNQTYFRLRLAVSNTPYMGQILGLEQFVPSNILAQVTRSIITIKKPNGTYTNVNGSRFGNLLVDIDNISRTSFDELKTASRYAQIELKSAVDQVSSIRNSVEVTDGTVTVNNTGEYRVATDAVLAGSALLESGERGRYIPGYEAEAGLGVRIPSQTWSGTQKVEWGYFDENNGLGYGKDATGNYVFIRRLGSDTKIYQSSWNKDRLDGSGDSNNPSGYTLDFSDGVVSQIEFIWYGYGAIQWYINMKDSASERGSLPVLVHTELPDNQTSIAQPNLPLSVKVSNGDQSTSREIFIGGRQFSIYGQPNERYRINGERRVSVSINNTGWTPLISFRRKSGVGNNQSVELANLDIVPDTNIFFTFVSGGTLTGASFGALSDVSTSETVVESDVSASAISGGTFFGGVHVATGNNKSENLSVLDQLDFDFVNSDAVTLVARSIAASGTVSVVTMNVREQW